MIYKRNYKLRVALVYPNRYQVASSCLAPRIIYDLLNQLNGVYCERFVHPESETIPPSSIESGTPLGKFQYILGTIQFELDYVNLCRMLEISRIPFLREEREKHDSLHILVIGGPVPTANPWLASAIADAVFLGEIEPTYERLIGSFQENSREAVLQALSEVPGLWIPAKNHFPTKIVRTTQFHTPLAQVIPDKGPKAQKGTFADHFLMELSRGCSRGCLFCLIGHTKRPARFAQVSDIVETVSKGIPTTGAKKVSFIGSSAADHPDLYDILQTLNLRKVPFVLPSLRIDSDSRIIEEIVKTGQRTITIAPESHIEEERFSLGKQFTNASIFDYANSVRKAKIRELRAYFISGIPETPFLSRLPLEIWIKEMNDFVVELRKRFASSKIRFSLTPFVPKPYTKLQQSVPDFNRMKREQDACIPVFKKAGIRFSLGSIRWAPVQTYLSMAGEGAAEIIRRVYLKGGLLNAWKKTVGNFVQLLETESERWNERFSPRYTTEWL